MARQRPEIPLHTNGSENDIRCEVTRRKVSAGTRSDTGREPGWLLGLAKTCAKHGIASGNLGAVARPGQPQIPPTKPQSRGSPQTTNGGKSGTLWTAGRKPGSKGQGKREWKFILPMTQVFLCTFLFCHGPPSCRQRLGRSYHNNITIDIAYTSIPNPSAPNSRARAVVGAYALEQHHQGMLKSGFPS